VKEEVLLETGKIFRKRRLQQQLSSGGGGLGCEKNWCFGGLGGGSGWGGVASEAGPQPKKSITVRRPGMKESLPPKDRRSRRNERIKKRKTGKKDAIIIKGSD